MYHLQNYYKKIKHLYNISESIVFKKAREVAQYLRTLPTLLQRARLFPNIKT